MKIKKVFSFDEEKDAEEIISKGFPNGAIDYGQMYLIAKYFKQNFGYGKVRLEKELIKFCKAQDKNFNPVVEASAIKKWVDSAMLYGLRKVKGIYITKKEIDFLKTIENQKDRKILFVTLVLSKSLKQFNTKIKNSKAKVSSSFYIRYGNFTDIIRLSKISNLTEKELANIYFRNKENFTFYNPEKELIKIKYVDPTEEPKVYVDDLDNMIEVYDTVFYSNAICTICGKEFKKNSNRQKACLECSKELTRMRVQKFRRK